jgi:hypothetical protein
MSRAGQLFGVSDKRLEQREVDGAALDAQVVRRQRTVIGSRAERHCALCREPARGARFKSHVHAQLPLAVRHRTGKPLKRHAVDGAGPTEMFASTRGFASSPVTVPCRRSVRSVSAS